jgi:hypothetical protein
LETPEGRIEIQAKKGLRGGKKLWEALEPIATGLGVHPEVPAVLLVDTTSSGTIKNDLSLDLRRIADGRRDDLTATGQATLEKLTDWGVDPTDIARRLTIVALDPNHARELMRRDLLLLWGSEAEANHAVTWLENEALQLIETRGRRDLIRLVSKLRSCGLEPARSAELPASHLARLTEWVERTTESFSVLGVSRPINTDAGWLPLDVKRSEVPTASNLEEALYNYHTGAKDDRRTDKFDIEWLGRFIPKCVLSGGPGSGKSLASQMIARRYAQDGFPVLRVSLNQLAARVQAGSSVEEACWQLGLGGSGLTVEDARCLNEWVLIADGLDECGSCLKVVSEGLARLGEGYRDWRIIVTTRPIGYDTTNLAAWKHYRLVDFDETAVHNGIHQLTKVISGVEGKVPRCDLKALPGSFRSALSRAPLLISLTASLVAAGRKIEGSRTQLYRSMITFIEEVSAARHLLSTPEAAVRRRVLEILGSAVVETPVATADQVDNRIAAVLAKELETTQLAASRAAESAVGYWCRVGLVGPVAV